MHSRLGFRRTGNLCLVMCALCALCICGTVWPQEKKLVRFSVEKILIENNTVLPESELTAFKERYEGRVMTVPDVKELAKLLEKKYRSRGCETTRVILPEQDVSKGRLVLRVVEGRIGTITVEGAKRFSYEHNYKPYLPREGEVLNLRELRAGLRVLNAHPDRKARAVLNRGKVEGTTDILLKVDETNPLHFSLGLNNTGTENTPRLRSVVTLQYDNFMDRSQIGIFQFTTAPDDVDLVKQYAASYSIPLAPLGGPMRHSVIAYGAYSDTKTETILDFIELRGKGTVAGMQYSLPLPEVLGLTQQLSIGLEWQKIKDTTALGDAELEDEVRKLPLVARWNGVARDRSGATNFWLGCRYQKDGLLRSFDDNDYEAVRRDADTTFWSAAMGLQRQQVLPRGWSLTSTATAFLSSDRLLPSEQSGLGGYNTVRGYRNRVVVADETYNLRTELRSPLLPRLLPEAAEEQLQLLAFLDGGWARNHDAGQGELDDENMSGAGVGLRATFFDAAVIARVDAGWAFEDLESTSKNEEGDLVVHFGVQCRY